MPLKYPANDYAVEAMVYKNKQARKTALRSYSDRSPVLLILSQRT